LHVLVTISASILGYYLKYTVW